MLAERLGMTVAELLDRISAAELSEWMAFDRVMTERRRQAELAASAAGKAAARRPGRR